MFEKQFLLVLLKCSEYRDQSVFSTYNVSNNHRKKKKKKFVHGYVFTCNTHEHHFFSLLFLKDGGQSSDFVAQGSDVHTQTYGSII